MTFTQSILAFLAAASILTITPGLDTAMVLRTAATSGARPAWLAAIGIALGCLAWGVIVATGLGALLAASPLAFPIVQWTGAAYLVWTGARLLLKPRSAFADGTDQHARSGREALRMGFLTNMLNPKVGVFYIAFLPQFMPAGADVALTTLLLAAIHVALGLVWFAGIIAATVPFDRWLKTTLVIKTLDRLTGGVFIIFGVKLALFRQP